MPQENYLNSGPYGPRPDYRNMENIPLCKSEQVKKHMKKMFQEALERTTSNK